MAVQLDQALHPVNKIKHALTMGENTAFQFYSILQPHVMKTAQV